MRMIFPVAMLLAALPASAQRVPEIDLDAVEARIAACRETPMEKDLAARLAVHGVARAPADLDSTLGIAVNASTGPELNPARAAEGLAEMLAANASDPGYRAAAAFYVLKDMAFYRDLNCKSIENAYRRVVVFSDLAAAAQEDDSLRAYYERTQTLATEQLARALRAGRRYAEKEAALLDVLGLESG